MGFVLVAVVGWDAVAADDTTPTTGTAFAGVSAIAALALSTVTTIVGDVRRVVVPLIVASIALVGWSFTALRSSVPSGDPWELPEFAVGTTHAQFSADPWQDEGSVDSARTILDDSVVLQNQHIMGFGALNPQPSPGVYDWETLDNRMDLISQTGSVPVVTLCCAPDWMKGGVEGETDWSTLEDAPDPEYFDEYAALAAEVAQRYPDVYYFLVWNELKGFYLNDEDRWNYEDYTELYNKVYLAVKEVRPDALIGGPYVVMDSWDPRDTPSHPSGITGPWGQLDQRPLDVLTYWLDNNVGSDFIVVDGRVRGYGEDTSVDPTTGLQKFEVVNRWLQDRTDLPIWWAEWYPNHPDVVDPDEAAQLTIDGLDITRSSGASVVLLWDPNGSEDPACHTCLWSDIRSGPIEPSPLAGALAEAPWRQDTSAE